MDQRYLLELLGRPAFCVADGVITEVNEPARQRQVTPGTQLKDLLVTGHEEYPSLKDGCLFLTLCICGCNYDATVTCNNGNYLFLLETDNGSKELQAISLAASRLREPLSNVMIIVEQLLESECDIPDSQSSYLKNNLYQMLRTVYNMSDASSYTTQKLTRSSTENLSGIINELMEKAGNTVKNSGRTISYQALNESAYTLCNKELLERAILNLVSNAVKFSPEGSEIQARLVRKGSKLLFTIENRCEGSSSALRNDIFARYLREPGLEDSYNGVGLGMVIVRAAAMAHEGTVLWEILQDHTARITMSLTLRANKSNDVRSPRLSYDYAGGRDHVLIELSDALSPTAYKEI